MSVVFASPVASPPRSSAFSEDYGSETERKPSKSKARSLPKAPSLYDGSPAVCYLSSCREVEEDWARARRVSHALIHGQMVSFSYSPPSHKYILDPTSRWKLAWDGLILLIVLYQALLVPVELAFVESLTLAEPYTVIWSLDSIFGCLFVMDIALLCLTAYIRPDGSIVQSQRLILSKYALAPPYLLFMDLLSLLPLLCTLLEAMGGNSSAEVRGKSSRLLFFLRRLRFLQLLRTTRAVKAAQKLSQIVILHDRYTVAAVAVARLLAGFFLCVHLGACLWRAVSAFEHHAYVQDVNVANTWESYVFCVWWMVMTLSGGVPPTDPMFSWERWVWSISGCVAICVVTVLTGMLVQVFNRFNEEVIELDQKLRVASKFISRRNVPPQVKASVLQAVRTSSHLQRNTGQFQELVDPLLNEDLRRKLYGSIYGPILRWFPPFGEDAVPCRFLARLAVDERIERYARDDAILHEGMVEDSMIFMVDGRAMLHSVAKRMQLPVVCAKWFLGERSLFWDPALGGPEPLRAFSLYALSPCEVLFIGAASFLEAVKDYGLCAWLAKHRKRYAIGTWGCPACGSNQHWFDECDASMLMDRIKSAESAGEDLQPFKQVAVQNFLHSQNYLHTINSAPWRPSSRTRCSSDERSFGFANSAKSNSPTRCSEKVCGRRSSFVRVVESGESRSSEKKPQKVDHKLSASSNTSCLSALLKEARAARQEMKVAHQQLAAASKRLDAVEQAINLQLVEETDAAAWSSEESAFYL